MSDAATIAVPLTALAEQRSAFKPICVPNLASAKPTAMADEYARGLIDGQQLTAATFEIEKSALLNLLANTQALKPDTDPELSILLRETVIRLARQIVKDIEIDAKYLESRIAEAVAIVTEADNARQIILHPDDAALVGDRIHSLAVLSDPDQPRGMVRIDCSQGWVEHGAALGIERLRELLELQI